MSAAAAGEDSQDYSVTGSVTGSHLKGSLFS
jgi:hypothetical protein